jgi:hypothetical protein
MLDEIYEEASNDGHDDLDYAAAMISIEDRPGFWLKGKTP